MGDSGGDWRDLKDDAGKFKFTITAHEKPAAEESAPAETPA